MSKVAACLAVMDSCAAEYAATCKTLPALELIERHAAYMAPFFASEFKPDATPNDMARLKHSYAIRLIHAYGKSYAEVAGKPA